MWRKNFLRLAVIALHLPAAFGQQTQSPKNIQVTVAPSTQSVAPPLAPIESPATDGQIREYLTLSGDLDSFRLSWIEAVDKNRSLGAPYWPESFWTAIKAEMQKTDLTPLFIVVYQHGVSNRLMQEVLDAYHTLGREHFQGSPACFKLGDAWSTLAPDFEKLKLAKTQEVITKIYAAYKPQIKAARAQYLADHPGWVDK